MIDSSISLKSHRYPVDRFFYHWSHIPLEKTGKMLYMKTLSPLNPSQSWDRYLQANLFWAALSAIHPRVTTHAPRHIYVQLPSRAFLTHMVVLHWCFQHIVHIASSSNPRWIFAGTVESHNHSEREIQELGNKLPKLSLKFRTASRYSSPILALLTKDLCMLMRSILNLRFLVLAYKWLFSGPARGSFTPYWISASQPNWRTPSW